MIANECKTWQSGRIALQVEFGRERGLGAVIRADCCLTTEPNEANRQLRSLAVEMLQQSAEACLALDVAD